MEHLTLAEVKSRFTEWRKKKQHREPIPWKLWDSAVSLTEKHSIHKVSKTLRLSYATLTQRAGTTQVNRPVPPPATPEFISVIFKFLL